MATRRKFIQHSAAFALGSMLIPQIGKSGLFSERKSGRPVGLQLYTMGGLMTSDTKGTLQKLAAIVYKEMECAGSQFFNFYCYKYN